MKGWSWKIGWQGRAEGPGRPSRGGRGCWTGGWGRGCGHTLSMLPPPPHSETLCDSSVLCDASLGLLNNFSNFKQPCDSENGIQKMERSPIFEQLTDPCPSCDSTSLDIDQNLVVLCGLGLLLLFLWYLVRLPFSSIFSKTKDIRKVSSPG